jgi:uncharacterized membrane protein
VALIDQRILIDAPPQVVWEYVSDPARVPLWHAGYRTISVLTTQQTGQGTRRRCTPAAGGKDLIEEITAWVDGLGYEYRVVEGGLYRSFQGRFRLQAGPDGTSVQWTVWYRPKGVLGAIKNRLSGERQMAAMMTASLRQLRRTMDELGVRMDAMFRAKVGIQGRLNVDERAHYQRRHAAPTDAESSDDAGLPAPEVAPGAAAPPAEGTPAPELIPDASMPSFVASLPGLPEGADYLNTADTEPKAPAGLRDASLEKQAADSAVGPVTSSAEEIATPPGVLPHEPAASEPAPAPLPGERLAPPEVAPERAPRSTGAAPVPPLEPIPRLGPRRAEPAAEPESQPEPDYRRPTPPRGTPVAHPSGAAERVAQPSPAPEEVPPSARPTPARGIPSIERTRGDQASEVPVRDTVPPPHPDTGDVSIWDVFGVRRPSEEADAVLQDLLQTVHAKQIEERARQHRIRRAIRVRQLHLVMGLRLRLALRAVRVRLSH